MPVQLIPIRNVALVTVQLVLVVCAFAAPSTSTSTETQPFAIDDYFELRRITELDLSSDGEMIAYVTESQSLEENETARSVYIGAARTGAAPELIPVVQDAYNIAWIPGRHTLAFLSNRAGTAQLYTYNVKSQQLRQRTHGIEAVTRFQFAPDGASFAWLTQARPDHKSAGFYDQVFRGDKGVIIDTDNTTVFQFINPEWPDVTARPTNMLWVKRSSDEAFQAIVPGRVKSFYWSPDTSMLSITFTDNNMPSKASLHRLTSLGYLDIATNSFRPIAHARAPSKSKKAQYFRGGEWLPDANELFIRRIVDHNAWDKRTSWTLANIVPHGTLNLETTTWHNIEMYGEDPEPAFIPVNRNIVYSVKTVRARRSLYEIGPSQIRRARILREVKGAVSLVRFSNDFDTSVFVSESFTRPPEVYIYQNARVVEQLTTLNHKIARRRLPKPREILWKSEDGTVVQGWLFEPPGNAPKRWPLLTFIHGGPTQVMTDEFAGNFNLWPYPFEVYALNNIAVFIPNYRGTRTFGDKFDEPSRLDYEPVDDIVSGINYLIEDKVADPERLAISGFSHGAWLASLVMARTKIFRAGAFAEGAQNMVVLYHLTPGWLNRDIHDVHNGVSIYKDPQHYIDMSADLHFAGLSTAMLFEAAAKVSAIAMMGSPKAAKRASLPAEFVVYPKIGHTMRIPRLQRESAERNFDWFRFWLQGHEDRDPDKQEQYERWSKMRFLLKADDEPDRVDVRNHPTADQEDEKLREAQGAD